MGSATKHPKTLLLQTCYVNECVFVEQGGTEVRHEHHLVPRAYGGVDGPTVTLCNTHHEKLHRIAERLIHKKPYFEYLKGERASAQHKLLYMATVVRNAYLQAKNDPNKLAAVHMTLNRDQKLMIDKLKAIYPKAKSRESILAIALQNLYNRHYIQ
jgi:hypothetical protein